MSAIKELEDAIKRAESIYEWWVEIDLVDAKQLLSQIEACQNNTGETAVMDREKAVALITERLTAIDSWGYAGDDSPYQKEAEEIFAIVLDAIRNS